MIFDYIRPQLTGNRTDVRYVVLTNDAGEGIMARSLQDDFGFYVLPLTAREINSDPIYYGTGIQAQSLTRHHHNLPKSTNVYLELNYKHGGVGGTDSWGTLPLEKYRLSNKKRYSYAYILTPITTEVDIELLGRSTYNTEAPTMEF